MENTEKSLVCKFLKSRMFIIGLLTGFLLISAISVNAAIHVVSPLDKTWVERESLFMAGAVDDPGAKQIFIKGVDTQAKGNSAQLNDGVFGVYINLDKGNNTIELTAGKDTKTINVFYAADRKKQNPPKDYRKFYVHEDPPELDCKECHRLRRGKYDFKRIVPAQFICVECHDTFAEAAHVHGPVGAGVCISCHSPHGSYEPLFLERTGAELCTVCHQAKIDEFKQNVVHAPVEEGCIDCHDPHQSPMRFQLRGKGPEVSTLCFNCHEEEIFTKDVRHGPVDEGDCIACHYPHASPNASLLIASPAEGRLCFVCHEDRKEEFVMENIHPPVEEDCSQCHDPHSSPNDYQLLEPGGQLCAMCHEDINPDVYEAIKTATSKHAPVDQGECTKCHRPHSSNYASMLKNGMEKLCFSCHTELGDYVADSKNRHGPVQTGDCTACHNIHGSQFTKLLARYYPNNFYTPYKEENYDLCFGCHNKEIAKNRTTTQLTNFRDGSYNLHYFHVNMKKGRTCTACHDPHASNQYKHIRYEVPFGAWSYPINITKKPAGATCVVGCHAPKTYNRKEPNIKPSR